MIYLEKNGYRVASIHNMVYGEMPASYGLALEKRCEDNKDRWYVVCFIKYNERERDAMINVVGRRILDVNEGEWRLVKTMIDTAAKIVLLNNNEVRRESGDY